MALSFVLLLVLFSPCTSAIFLQTLSGRWNVTCESKGISVPGQVPGSQYTALIAAKVIPDPLYRDNDVKLAWVGQENWTYTRHFTVSAAMTQASSIFLEAEGLDTMATITVNGQMVGLTDNMFVKYTFNVKPVLKPGDNTIAISFQSAVDVAKKRAESYPYRVPPTCPPPVQHGQCHVNMVRKEQCSFSWDWGPSFPTQGIWKPIYLKAFDSAVLDMATVEVVPGTEAKSWVLRTKTYFNMGSSPVTGKLTVSLDGTNVSVTHDVTLTPQSSMMQVNVSVPQSCGVKRWWPNGYGNQSLYDVYFVFTADNGELTSLKRRIGFRTIELVQDPVSSDPKQGLTFYFRVNGFPIFLKGSNWIPADSFQERITKDRLRTLLQSAADAHMNAMRVWGGGVYESEDFYDLTDELGIMVWQDLMFSVAFYPTDPDFLLSVTKEVTHQVRRLMHRPSILLWAGSNENEKALRQNWFDVSNYTRYYDDYVKLYVGTILPVVRGEDPGRVYLTSSPSDGKDTVREGYVAKDPGSELYGDIHFYDYSMDQWVPGAFRIPRMATEYGVQAWCSMETVQAALDHADLTYCSPQADHRQHHQAGSVEMEFEIIRHLSLPPSAAPEPRRFENMIYLTQINQAMSIKSQTEHYRRHQSALMSDGRGLTMGALYWQLNDIWQAPTWASIDYAGRWKMLHYFALKFFGPTLVSPLIDGDFMDVFIVIDQIPSRAVRDHSSQHLTFEPLTRFSDLLASAVETDDVLDLTTKVTQKVNGVLYMEMYSWNNFVPLHQWTVPYKLNTTAESVLRRNLTAMMSEAGCSSKKDCFLHFHTGDSKTTAPADNWVYLAELKDSNLQKANVSIVSVHQESECHFSVSLSSTAIAPFVWLEAHGIMGRFSDNGFLLLRPTATVSFLAWDDVDYHTLKVALTVRSLSDIY